MPSEISNPGLNTVNTSVICAEVEIGEGGIVLQCIGQSLWVANVNSAWKFRKCPQRKQTRASTPISPIWFPQRLRLERVLMCCNASARACWMWNPMQIGKVPSEANLRAWAPGSPTWQSERITSVRLWWSLRIAAKAWWSGKRSTEITSNGSQWPGLGQGSASRTF